MHETGRTQQYLRNEAHALTAVIFPIFGIRYALRLIAP
jgi:hypothetical protein